MRKYSLLVHILIFIIFGSCSKDLGNYDYKNVNEIHISGLLEGEHEVNRIYNLVFKDTLRLNPEISSSMLGDDIRDFEFEWKVEGESISKTKDFLYVADKKYGKLRSEYTIFDKTTSTKETYHFFIDIVNPYKLGYYVLSKNAQSDAVLYCKSSIVQNSVFENVLIPSLGNLGKNPTYISLSRTYISRPVNYYNNIVLAVKDAVNPVVQIDSREFLPSYLYNSNSAIGGGADFIFAPDAVLGDAMNPVIYVANQGKLQVLMKGLISSVQLYSDPLDYRVSEGSLMGTQYFSYAYLSFYDTKNKTIRIINNENRGNYVYTKSFDDAIDQRLIDGYSFVLGQELYGDNGLGFVYLMQKGNQLATFSVTYSEEDEKFVSFKKLGEQALPNGASLLGGTFFDPESKFWYFAVGNSIYRSSILGLEFQKVFELPLHTGEMVTKMSYSSESNKIIVGTHDAAFSGEKKGSVYVLDIPNLSLDYSGKHVVEEIVSVAMGI